MMMTSEQDAAIASSMFALAKMFEGEVSSLNRIQYQSVVGWNEAVVRDRCRLIDAARCDGVVALFDPLGVERGPAVVGVCFADRDMVRLQFGALWLAGDADCAILVPTSGDVRDGHYLVDNGRIMRRNGWPADDLTRGIARAARRLRDLAVRGGSLSTCGITG